MDDHTLGDILLHQGKITLSALNEALAQQTFMGGARLGEILVELGHCNRVDVEAALIEQTQARGLPVDHLAAADRLTDALDRERDIFNAEQDRLRHKTIV